MAVLFEATDLSSEADRNAAVEKMYAQLGVPMHVEFCRPAERTSIRFQRWRFGTTDLIENHAPGLKVTRTHRHVRAAAPEAIWLGFQVSGTYTLSADGYDESRGAGHVRITDQTLPAEFTQYGAAASNVNFQLSYDQLGFPVEVVRKAARILPSSPVYALMQAHMASLWRRVDALARDASAGMIGDATLELARALIASAGQDDFRTNSVMNETLYTRIVAFIHNNLTDPGLSPERIAREHYISVRQLYELWAHHELSLAEWIMSERLEGARRALAVHASASTTIGAIARRWGFRDSAHFSRRFRAAYGLTPREWRQLNQS